MKRLTLVRHAKSGQKDGSIPDFDRPLASRGKQDAPEMGRRLAARGCAPDAVVTSPAKRARKTAEKVARELSYPAESIHLEPDVYEASVSTLLAIVRGFDDAWGHVMLVGHNPGFEDLANALGNPGLDKLPTCGVVCLDFPASSWGEVQPGSGSLVFFDYPKNDAPNA